MKDNLAWLSLGITLLWFIGGKVTRDPVVEAQAFFATVVFLATTIIVLAIVSNKNG